MRMTNEDAHLGVVLLPFDVHRAGTRKIHSHGVSGCTPAADIAIVHYVKDTSEHDCFAAIHTNITAGRPVCKNRYCGPRTCDARPGPTGKKRCKPPPGRGRKWEPIAQGKACEKNADGVARAGVAKHMVTLECCLQHCEHTCGCTAVDYYGEGSMWCNLFSEPCKKPLKNAAQGGSWRMIGL